jgi:hypothetical protein
MKTIDIKSLLINEKNINLLKKNENTSWNVKRLLDTDLDQSQSIRFGNMFQDFIKSVVIAAGGEVLSQQFADVYETGNTDSNKGLKDVDIWFKFNSKMYYFEAKTNLDLDSEKSKATDNKVEDVTMWMKKNYSDIEVVSGVLSCWFKKETGLSVKVKNVFFMEDIFNILDIEMTSEDYYTIMKEFGKSLKK